MSGDSPSAGGDASSSSTVRRRKRGRKITMSEAEIEQDKQDLNQRTNQQMLVYLLVACVIIGAWALGTLGCSFIWIFCLLFVTFWIWYKKVTSIVEKALRKKETLLLRRRNLRQSETAEWLNFILNRW